MIQNFDEKLQKYAELTVRFGIALQKGQEVNISSPVECAPFARILAKTAYLAGARIVTILWNDEKTSRIHFDYATKEALCDIPNWQVEQRKHFINRGTALISIAADDPDIFTGVDPEKLQANYKARAIAFKEYMDAVTSNKNRWCVVSVPTAAWAKRVFEGKTEPEAMEMLWNAIFAACRINDADPTEQWQKHLEKLQQKMQFLNEADFDSLHFTNSLGTDITVGLAENHLWACGGEKDQTGIEFIANIPTEEVFTTPHKDRINGTVYSSLPLNHNGSLIDRFRLTLKDGKIVDFAAEVGYDTLKHILNTDEGVRSFGEVALVPAGSSISSMGFLFLNTLFDENASCHFALGRAYPTCVKNGVNMTEEQLAALGANHSLEHIDFMFGTPDMRIIAKRKNGELVPLFINGDWVI